MNRTQKGAWFGLVVPCFCLGWLFIGSIITPRLTWIYLPIVFFLLMAPVVMFIVIRKKQSPAEVASDERDSIIKAKAVMASFISLLLMLPVLISVMCLISNDEGLVPAVIMIPLSILIFLIAITVYSISTLVQYGRGGGNGGE